jgi:hypothetical protein
MAQIIELLDERNLAVAFCFGETELLQKSAIGLLLQNIEMGSESKLITSVLDRLASSSSSSSVEIRKFGELCLKDKPRQKSAEKHRSSSSRKEERRSSKSAPSKSSKSKETKADKQSRKTLPYLPSSSIDRPSSSESMASVYTTHNPFARSEPSLSMSPTQHNMYPANGKAHVNYMSFADPGQMQFPGSSHKDEQGGEGADWVQMLSNLDNGHANIYDGIYGGPGNTRSDGQNQPPSLGDYSSLASGSPRALHSVTAAGKMSSSNARANMNQESMASTTNGSMSCDNGNNGADLWTIVPDFRSPVDGTVNAGMNGASPLSSIEDLTNVASLGVTDVGRDEFSLFEAFM